MPKANLYNSSAEKIGEIELNDSVFAAEVNSAVLHEVVVAHLANKRQGTKSALTRAEVRGGGRKPWRQKGTGRARQGSTRSPQWRHGGVVFAPKPRDFRISVNKKVRKIGVRSALSSKFNNNSIFVVDGLNLAQAKTKEMAKILKGFEATKALIVTDTVNESVVRAANNIPNVATATATSLSTYDILKYDKFIVTKDAVSVIEEVFA